MQHNILCQDPTADNNRFCTQRTRELGTLLTSGEASNYVSFCFQQRIGWFHGPDDSNYGCYRSRMTHNKNGQPVNHPLVEIKTSVYSGGKRPNDDQSNSLAESQSEQIALAHSM